VTAAPRSATLALLVVLLSMFAAAAHWSIIGGESRHAVGALLSLTPAAVLVVGALRRARRPQALLVVAVAAGIALWFAWPALERNFPGVFFVEHAGANLVLALVFGRTLAGDREPLCARFARMLHGALPPDVQRYTRQVTVAWTVFFVVLFVLSCGLYLGGFLAAWSLLANILSPLLVAAMFLVEYLVRLRMLPTWERTGILGGIRAFARYFATVQPEPRR
jgi:uncharacterized membrane protein